MTNPPELLTNADRVALSEAWDRSTWFADLAAVVERIVRARMADVWDEGFERGHADGHAGRWDDACTPNPYRDEEPTA